MKKSFALVAGFIVGLLGMFSIVFQSGNAGAEIQRVKMIFQSEANATVQHKVWLAETVSLPFK